DSRQAQNSSSDSSSKSYDESHIEQTLELQSIPNTPNLSKQSSEQNTDLQKTKIPEIDIQSLIEKLRIEALVGDTVKIVNVDVSERRSEGSKSSTDNQQSWHNQSPATKLYSYRKFFEKRHSEILPEILKNKPHLMKQKAYELASSQIYDEMLCYLSGISQTYSANKLSKLTDVQINTVIYEVSRSTEKYDTNLLLRVKNSLSNMTNSSLNDISNNEVSIPTEADAKVSSFESQKLIGMKNSSRAHGQPKSDIETKVCEETLPKTETKI
ncbi:36804_t:CDS:2, partial [Racocetra persica]